MTRSFGSFGVAFLAAFLANMAPASAQTEPAGGGGGEAVRFEPDEPGLSLFARAGSTGVTHVTHFRHFWYFEHRLESVYAPLCEGPCALSLAPGTYALALSNGGRPVPAEPVMIREPSLLRGHLVDRSGLRAAGVVVGLAGLAAGITMIVVSLQTEQGCGAGGCSTVAHTNDVLLVGGLVTIAASAIVGSILSLQRDHAFITVTPLALSSSERPGESIFRSIARPEAAGLTLRF